VLLLATGGCRRGRLRPNHAGFPPFAGDAPLAEFKALAQARICQPAVLAVTDPGQPSTYPRRALVALSGLSPQVITETLYALLRQEPPFLPTELHLVTTEEGKSRALGLLQHPQQGLAALWAQHGRGPQPVFEPDIHIHVIRDAEQSLADVTDAGHHVGTADSILEALRPLALDPRCAIHASISGGRKSMSFYMGYVMSLLAREQDRMSHVLVNAPFEHLASFAFPPQPPVELALPDGRSISTSEARIKLSPVAFVHLYDRLPQQLLESRVSFQALVEHADMALARPQLLIDLPRCRVGVRSPGRTSLAIALSPAEMALYAYLADVRRHAGPADAHHPDSGLVRFPTVKGETDLSQLDGRRLARLIEPLNLEAREVLRSWATPTSRTETFNGIKTKLSRAMSERLFIVVRVWGPTERGRGKDGGYGLLGLEPGQIHFGNVSPD